MKMVIFGGGGSYTPELVEGLIQHYHELPVSELCLLDINERRLEILGGLSQRMIAKSGLPITVTTTTDRQRGLDGAAFVNSIIRVGGMEARSRDERVPLKYGIVGQETTGPGGMMKALRTVPVIVGLAKDVERYCPDAWIINYTNPSGIMAEALGKYSCAKFVGLCSGPIGWVGHMLQLMGVAPARANVDWMGLNHLGFITRVWVDGKDATEQAIEAVAGNWAIDGEWIRILGAIPASYLAHYYHRGRQFEKTQEPGYRTRAEFLKELEAEMLQVYSDPNLDEKPELLKQRGGGGYAEVAFASMLAIQHNKGERQITQVLNQGALDDIPADASVEVPCIVDSTGPHPLCMGAIPLPIRGLIQAVKAYESLTVQAAMEGSKRIAMQALMAHPLVPSWEVAKPLLDDLLAANKEWIPWA
ncbi:MAG: 6-phospho-beta-glucosidase [Anaerolineae bacterium]